MAQVAVSDGKLQLLKNPKDIMLGTKIYDGIVYAYVTVIKSNSTADNLKYADGYIDADTLRQRADRFGYAVEVVAEGEHYDYLARMTKK